MKQGRIIGLFFILVGTMLSSPTLAQLEGAVSDAINSRPLGNVHILSGDSLVALSNSKGYFKVSSTEGLDSLHFKHLGYHTKSIPVLKFTKQVSLQPKSESLKGVAVKGYSWEGDLFSMPAPVNVLNRKALDNLAVSRPAEVLNAVSGIYAHSGARNTNRITIRGIGARSMYSTTKIKAYLNGIPLTSGMGETTLEDMDMDLIDRISVLKGPSATIYGVPLGGVIHMQVAENPAKGGFVKSTASIGSFGLMKNSIEANQSGGKTSVRIAYNHLESDGFRENDNYNRNAVTTILQQRVSKKLLLTYFGRYHKVLAHIPSSLSRTDYLNDPRKAAANWNAINGHEDYYKFFNGLSMQWNINKNLSNQTGVFYKKYAGYERRPFNVLDDNTATLGGRTLFKLPLKMGKQELLLQTGYEFFYEEYKWKIFESIPNKAYGGLLNRNAQDRYYHNAFATGTIKWKSFNFSFGLNMNQTAFNYDDLTNDSIDYSVFHRFDNVFSPRFSLAYKFNSHLMAFAAMGHGFSAPSYEEAIDSEGFANTALRPETGWSREGGLRADLLRGNLFLEAAYFNTDLNNMLVTKRLSEDRYTKINAGEVNYEGIELTLRSQVFSASNLKSSLNLSYTYSDYRFHDFTDEGTNYSGKSLPGIPRNKLFLSANVELFRHMYIHANWLWADRMPMNDANSLYSDSYGRLNLKAGVNLPVHGKWIIKAYGAINNMTNEHYPAMVLVNAVGYGGNAPRYYYPAPPGNVEVGVSLGYFF